MNTHPLHIDQVTFVNFTRQSAQIVNLQAMVSHTLRGKVNGDFYQTKLVMYIFEKRIFGTQISMLGF